MDTSEYIVLARWGDERVYGVASWRIRIVDARRKIERAKSEPLCEPLGAHAKGFVGEEFTESQSKSKE